MSVQVAESYRLPPYSTVIGMVHNLCGFTEYHPLRISVQGEYQTIIGDMYTRYFFGTTYDATRHQCYTENEDGKKDGITRGLGTNELLVDLKLVLHILPEEKDYQAVLAGLKKPAIYPSLGRYEDLMRIDKLAEVELEPTDSPDLEYDAYVPESLFSKSEGDIVCPRYLLNKVYRVDPKRGCREWERVAAFYIAKGSELIFDEQIAYREKGGKTGVFLA
jgi:CRISPR-associated protein Cas5t